MNTRTARLRPLLPVLALCLSPCAGLPASPTGAPAVQASAIQQLDWESLLPDEERENYNPLQTGSSEVNRTLDGKHVRIPGFVVPLERSPDGLISEFFLVPYFGACIHVPPPPPNQIVFVRMRKGAGLRSIDDAVWVIGTLHAESRRSDLGSAAYSLDGEKLEPYQYAKP
jgi:hypothetical protein